MPGTMRSGSSRIPMTVASLPRFWTNTVDPHFEQVVSTSSPSRSGQAESIHRIPAVLRFDREVPGSCGDVGMTQELRDDRYGDSFAEEVRGKRTPEHVRPSSGRGESCPLGGGADQHREPLWIPTADAG